ncbi:NUDIX domain-containing protein [Actinomadura sp. 3N407]|uniref:NUDIX domain-containing protein n=1 Tax=Actinomadura sp. 3N407 TaxID=3457423 RepID=UPI003FCE4176
MGKPSTKTREVRKVRALVVDASGRSYGITGNSPHILQLPGGKLKPGESWLAGLDREMAEELGVVVKVTGKPAKIRVRRCGVIEVTRCYPVTITRRIGKPRPTGREMARGLRPARHPSPKALAAALRKKVHKHRRSAARRDLALLVALGAA